MGAATGVFFKESWSRGVTFGESRGLFIYYNFNHTPMKYLLAFFLLIPLLFVSQDALAVGPKIDSVYADSIIAFNNFPDSLVILRKPDSIYAHFFGNGPLIDLAFKKFNSNKLQTIKAGSKIFIWAKKDKAAGVDSSAGLITFWFDDGIHDPYNTQSSPLVINDGLNFIQVPNQDFTYVELTLAQNQFGKGATSFYIDAVALVQDTTPPPKSVPSQSVLARSIISYPNPFIQNTTIRFELETQGDIQLAVIDALGREVDHVQAGFLENGSHEIPLAIKTPGFYFVRLFINGQQIGNPLKITSR